MERHRKQQLRELNARAWAGESDLIQLNATLDSSLKKNTAFIKRLRTAITSATLASFIQDISTLSLHKYLSEIISASYEGLCKLKAPSEIAAGVEVISALHQRFGPAEFTSVLGWLLGRGLAAPDRAHLKALSGEVREKEERERLARQKNLLKVVAELWLVGVLRSLDDVKPPTDTKIRAKDDAASSAGKGTDGLAKSKTGPNGVHGGDQLDAAPFLLEVLKDILGQDKEHTSLSLIIIFLKAYTWDILGLKQTASDDRRPSEEGAADGNVPKPEEAKHEGEASNSVVVEYAPMVSADLQQRFRNIFTQYFDGLKVHLVREHKSLAVQAQRNAEAYVRSGEIFEDRQANHERRAKAQDKLVSDAQILSNILKLDMPDLTLADDRVASVNGSVGLVNTSEYLRGNGEGAGIWEDEDERRFYENLVDLKERVPGILLEDGKKKQASSEDQNGKKAETGNEAGNAKSKDLADRDISPTGRDKKELDNDDQSLLIVNKTVGARVDILLARLPELTSKDTVDEVAIEFCFLNSKASRNRLIKALQEVPKGRTDLFPFYARLIATLGEYMADVSQGIVSHLDAEFRSLQRRKDKDFLSPVRTSNVRYLAELTKFGLVPEHIIFHCLKVSLDDFSRVNIEVMCHFLENCGRYLLRNPETSPRMQSFMEMLQRKKAAQHLGQQERMLIENAIYYIDPPERTAIQRRERTPVELYVRKLVYLDMNKRNYTKILKQLRKLHWEEQEVVNTLRKVFAKPGKVKHNNIHLLAILAGALYRYHQDFVIGIVDDLLEYVTLGLEQNDFKFNQRRISEMKYLGELYNYKMVDSPVIFDTFYRILTFGHDGGTPRPDRPCELDLPDDFFRVRLVCTLLETCGMCFDRGSAKKKLDFFLTFFQYYIYTKIPMPMDIEFLVRDIFALVRPHWQLATGIEEASQKFAEAVAQNYKGQEAERAAEPEEMPLESSSDGDLEEDENRLPELEEVHTSSDDNETSVPGEGPAPELEEEKIVVTRPEEQRDPELDAEFDRELAKLTAESLDSRKFDRKPMFDVPLPIRRNDQRVSGAPDDGATATVPGSSDTMAFSLLTKRGNRQQTRTVELPADSNFAVAMKTQQQAERDEQKRIKDLVLNYDLRGADEHDGDDLLSGNQHIINAKKGKAASGTSASQIRLDKTGFNRGGQPRTRRLQMSDMNWYDMGSF